MKRARGAAPCRRASRRRAAGSIGCGAELPDGGPAEVAVHVHGAGCGVRKLPAPGDDAGAHHPHCTCPSESASALSLEWFRSHRKISPLSVEIDFSRPAPTSRGSVPAACHSGLDREPKPSERVTSDRSYSEKVPKECISWRQRVSDHDDGICGSQRLCRTCPHRRQLRRVSCLAQYWRHQIGRIER